METKSLDLTAFFNQHLEQQDAFNLLNGICQQLRNSGKQQAQQQLNQLIQHLQNDPDQGKQIAELLGRWLCEIRVYPLLISNGIFAREGFRREIRSRLYEKINPAFKDINDLRDVFFMLFSARDDRDWLENISLHSWLRLLKILRIYMPQAEQQRLAQHLRDESLFAIKMLSIWLAAEDLEPELIRLDPSMLNADSPFVALNKEITAWTMAMEQRQAYDDSHLQVMYQQSCEQVERLQKRGAAAGSSLAVAHLLARLRQTLERLAMLLEIFTHQRSSNRSMLLLVGKLAIASAEQHSISDLWKNSVKMVSRSITEHTSDHGEHYITRDKKEYLAMFYSAAGGGVLIALMALFKLYLSTQIEDKVYMGLAAGLNYGIGFVIIFMLHFTVATKQPAMTAARFAEAVERKQGKTVNMQLAQLLVDVWRSQSIAVLGNLLMAISVAAAITYAYAYFNQQALLNTAEINYQLHSIDPKGGTLWFAAIAGVWLFCSGIIAGFFENRSNYLNLRMRLRHHPFLTLVMSENCRGKFADYLHENYGSIMGNLCFGMLLGITGIIGYLFNIPLDIRHVAFSSANVGYAVVSGNLGWEVFVQSVAFVLLIGIVNLVVSFALTLWVALRSLGVEVESWREIIKCFCQIVCQRPLSLFLPVQLEK